MQKFAPQAALQKRRVFLFISPPKDAILRAKMDCNEDIVLFWKKSAELDRKTSGDLFRSKNYVGCLFFVHLYLEKILKGLVQKATGKTPPFTHDLLILMKIAGISPTKEQEAWLATINTFNIKARYADYKFSFYKRATRKFAAEYCQIAEEFYTWFSNQY